MGVELPTPMPVPYGGVPTPTGGGCCCGSAPSYGCGFSCSCCVPAVECYEADIPWESSGVNDTVCDVTCPPRVTMRKYHGPIPSCDLGGDAIECMNDPLHCYWRSDELLHYWTGCHGSNPPPMPVWAWVAELFLPRTSDCFTNLAGGLFCDAFRSGQLECCSPPGTNTGQCSPHGGLLIRGLSRCGDPFGVPPPVRYCTVCWDVYLPEQCIEGREQGDPTWCPGCFDCYGETTFVRLPPTGGVSSTSCAPPAGALCRPPATVTVRPCQ